MEKCKWEMMNREFLLLSRFLARLDSNFAFSPLLVCSTLTAMNRFDAAVAFAAVEESRSDKVKGEADNGGQDSSIKMGTKAEGRSGRDRGESIDLQWFLKLQAAELGPSELRDLFKGDGKLEEDMGVAVKFWAQNTSLFLSANRPDSKISSLVENTFRGWRADDMSEENATRDVNKWISDQTSGFIGALLPDGHPLRGNPLLYAICLINLKLKWVEKFQLSDPEDFYLRDGGRVKVSYLTTRKAQLINSFAGFKILGLPYQLVEKKQYVMYILLPDGRDGIQDLFQLLTSGIFILDDHLPNQRRPISRFQLPMFEISSRLRDTEGLEISTLQIQAAFDSVAKESQKWWKWWGKRRHATTRRAADRELHEFAQIKVDEEGSSLSAFSTFTEKLEFIADRPFVFMVKQVDGPILFIGSVVNPAPQGGVLQESGGVWKSIRDSITGEFIKVVVQAYL